jgi:hypothetical protein
MVVLYSFFLCCERHGPLAACKSYGCMMCCKMRPIYAGCLVLMVTESGCLVIGCNCFIKLCKGKFDAYTLLHMLIKHKYKEVQSKHGYIRPS